MASSDKSTLMQDSATLAAALTPDTESVAYTGTVGDATAAKLDDLNALRVAFENLRVDYQDLRAKLITANVINDGA
jgi:hypothetical protein